MIKTDANDKASQLHEWAMHQIKDLHLDEVQDELFDSSKEKSGTSNEIV